jgi:putative ABC transport system permease protein
MPRARRADLSLLERVAALRSQRDWKDSAAGGPHSARVPRPIVGVLEPSVPYPVATEIIANVVTSPHHLSATMVTGREHRMTEVFARLAPGATLDNARAELRTRIRRHGGAHPEVYKPEDHFRIDVTRMHEQINSRANTILWMLFAARACCS